MKKILTVLMFVSVFTMLFACENEENIPKKYMNPVFEPVIADPSIIKAEDGYYYVYGTEDLWDYDYGKHLVPIIKSADLVNWEFVGDAFEFKPSWKFGGLWAPDIQYFNNKYYLYYSISVWGDSNPAIGVATSDSPSGPFEDHGKLFDSYDIGVDNSIDPFVYTEEDGTRYMFWGSFRGIYAIQLSEDGLSTVGEKVEIAGNAFEATYIIKENGYYYFFGSAGSCCSGENSTYNVRVARSTSLLGPYIDKEGKDIRFSDGSLVLGPGEKFVGVGHNSIIKDDNGDHWIVYHGIDIDNPYLPDGATRRPLMIDKLIWSSDGWPQVKNFMPSEKETDIPYIKK